MYVFTQPFRMNRMRHKVSFKENLIVLNSQFSYSETDWRTIVKDQGLPYYIPVDGGKKLVSYLSSCRVHFLQS